MQRCLAQRAHRSELEAVSYLSAPAELNINCTKPRAYEGTMGIESVRPTRGKIARARSGCDRSSGAPVFLGTALAVA
jgi:hypothetical protein